MMEEAKEVRPVLIELVNVKGIPKAELRFRKTEPGKGQLITLIGDNGAGKTSFILGIEGIFAGGFRPQLIRDGCDKATARMMLSDGTDIKRTITRKTSRIDIEKADGTPVKAPETYLKRLASGFGFDPIQFCTAKKEDRLKYLLSVIDLDFKAEEIHKAIGRAASFVTVGDCDITGLNRLVKDLTEKRRAIGSRRDEKAASIESFRKTLAQSDQADDPRDWKRTLADLETLKARVEQDEREEVAEINRQLNEIRNALMETIRNADDGAQKEFRLLLEAARCGSPPSNANPNTEELGTALKLLSNSVAVLAKAEGDANIAVTHASETRSYELEKLAAMIATARAVADEQIRSGAVREQMDKLRSEANALSNDWDMVATAIKAVDELRRSKLKALPVQGLEVRDDGTIWMDGRDFDEWNEGQRFLYALSIGAVGIGEAGFMFADEYEHLGPANQDMFAESVEASGLIVVVARVATRDEVEKHGPGLRSEPQGALVLA